MKWLELYKLKLRAKKYRKRDDVGGIGYIMQTVKPGQTVLDIGAHKGGYLYTFLGLVGKQGRVFAFEPQSLLYNYLVKMKDMLQWNNVNIDHVALSDTEKDVTLYIPTNHVSAKSAPGATILDISGRSDLDFTETVHTDSLDHYCAAYHIAPDFLKIDVEGNEMNIFIGGMETIRKYKPRILVEIDANYVGEEKVLETFRLMQSLGYKGSFILSEKRIPLEEFEFATHHNRNNGGFFCNNFVFE